MSRTQRLVLAFLCGALAGAGIAPADTPYPMAPEIRQANAVRATTDQHGAPAPWKNAACIYYAVPALSPVKRLPDTFPEDGQLLSPLQVVAAQGEYEPASFVVYPFQAVTRLELKAGDLHDGGTTIPASALDLKVVKVWYQAGSAWYGYFADRTQRVPIPELLLNDEGLIRVDHATRDNYVRYECLDGVQRYAWMSFLSSAVNHSGVGQANLALITDSPTLQPAALTPGEFKQFWVTVAVPEKAAPGLYKGAITVSAEGREIGEIPVVLRVLPFALPRPATYYNPNKEFYGSVYCQPLELDKPKILRNLKAHNILNPMLPRLSEAQDPKAFDRMINQLKEAGLSTKPLFGAGPRAGFTVDTPPDPAQQLKLDGLEREAAEAIESSVKSAGHRELYSYGYDEGGPSVLRRERPAWRRVHEAGGKTMVSSYAHGRLIYNLDYLIIPGMPVDLRKKAVDLWHASNPDALVAWYANPHSGPENPDYFRRIHGMMTYKANYDAISNYVWYRNNWNDFWVPAESMLRGLMMVYPTRDNVIDTLEWEGVREGLDDVRYATRLSQLAAKAMASQDVNVREAGRKAMSWLAYWDEAREDLDAGRLEMIETILTLEAALKGGRS